MNQNRRVVERRVEHEGGYWRSGRFSAGFVCHFLSVQRHVRVCLYVCARACVCTHKHKYTYTRSLSAVTKMLMRNAHWHRRMAPSSSMRLQCGSCIFAKIQCATSVKALYLSLSLIREVLC